MVPRFEHGFSQIIDWFTTLDDFKKTDKFEREFGKGHVTFTGLLVVGRDASVSDDYRGSVEVAVRPGHGRFPPDLLRHLRRPVRTLRDRLQVYAVPGRQKK